MKIKTLILAAGDGTRMHSNLAKVMHKAAGKTLIEHVLDASKNSKSDEYAAVLGHQREKVQEVIPKDVEIFEQKERLGTGHAVLSAQDFINEDNSIIVVLNGDAPLISSKTIDELIDRHLKNKNQVTVLTAKVDNPTGYGRIITEKNKLIKIVEEKDATDQEKKIREVNSGVYCFNAENLVEALGYLKNNNQQNEYYLTDTIEIIKELGGQAGIYLIKDKDELAAVNSKQQLAQVERIFRKKKNKELMDNGVTIMDPNNTYIDLEVKVKPDTIIFPGCLIEGNTIIGSDCLIGPNSRIKNSQIKDHVTVENSTVLESFIDTDTNVGPYAYLRPNSCIGKDVKIGDFVEVKNSTVGDHSKASHLTYIGDSDIGENVNLGCGTVFVNYNGQEKNRCIIEDDCFIGCNTNLIAPVKVGKNSYTAAGSTITDNVPENTLAIARNKQVNKEGYVNKLISKNKNK